MAIYTVIAYVQDIKQSVVFSSWWASLEQYRCPEWFRNAKFGIWSCWGPNLMAAGNYRGDWYVIHMYIQGISAYKCHLEHFGHPSKFGYKDLPELWKAEKLNPYCLMSFYKAGTKYIVSLARFHDNFDLWDSKSQKKNSFNLNNLNLD